MLSAGAGNNYGTPTVLDHAHAMAFANNMVAKLKCQDPEVVAVVCNEKAGGGTCIQWSDEPESQTYPTPQNYYKQQCTDQKQCAMGKCSGGICSCQTDADCLRGMSCMQDPDAKENLICGFAPKGTTAGHCLFTNQTACEAQGMLPYTCDDQGYCTTRPNKEIANKGYTEWHIDKNGNGTCVNGNWLLRQWCENPGSRCEKNSDGSYPASCTGDQTTGITTVPPFFYNKNNGMCYMTNDYCQNYGNEYNMGDCQQDSDCGTGNYCNATDSSSTCVGPGAECEVSTGDKVGKFFVGSTLFYMFKKGKCEGQSQGQGTHTSESYVKDDRAKSTPSVSKNDTPVPTKDGTPSVPSKKDFAELAKDIHEQFKDSPETAVALADSKFITNKIIIGKDFAGPGIHLYMIVWKSGQSNAGFLADEVEKQYPDMVENHPRGKLIIISRNELGTDKNLKRIYLIINSKGWMTEIIKKLVNK
jgi:hypothetical protein